MTSAANVLSALVAQRYAGQDPGPLADPSGDAEAVLPLLLRHHSVRRYAQRPVEEEVLRAVVAAAQSASTSSHNQCVSIIVVRDAERRRALVENGRVSSFAAAAPVLLVFAVDWARATGLAADEGEPAVAVEYLESTLVGFVDAGIMAQNAVIAAESLGLGTCYLGSMRNEPATVAAELGLPSGVAVAFGVAVGYPAASGTASLKPRLPQSVVCHDERYRPAEIAELRAFAARMDAFYAARGRTTSWLRDVVARVRDIAGLHGREGMRESLSRRGLPSR